MADKTGIEWTDATWNPVRGCTKVSPGCDNCYAERDDNRWNGPGSFDQVRLFPERLDQPSRWRRPRRIFVNSMSDLFHDAVPDEYIARVFAVMAQASHHTFQILTKRHARMRSLLRKWAPITGTPPWVHTGPWPLPNVWLGVSVEDQKRADLRIPALLETPAAVRWISAEPLLGPVDLTNVAGANALEPDWMGGPTGGTGAPHPLLDWVVAGGESGPGARPMHPDWARSLRDQCEAAEVPFLFKQWGAWTPTRFVGIGNQGARFAYVGEPVDENRHRAVMERVGKKAAGRELDGRTWNQYPQPATAGAR